MEAIILFLGGMGMQELLIIGLFILVFFGAKRIPEFMRGLGKGAREFKDSLHDIRKDHDDTEPADGKKREQL